MRKSGSTMANSIAATARDSPRNADQPSFSGLEAPCMANVLELLVLPRDGGKQQRVSICQICRLLADQVGDHRPGIKDAQHAGRAGGAGLEDELGAVYLAVGA